MPVEIWRKRLESDFRKAHAAGHRRLLAAAKALAGDNISPRKISAIVQRMAAELGYHPDTITDAQLWDLRRRLSGEHRIELQDATTVWYHLTRRKSLPRSGAKAFEVGDEVVSVYGGGGLPPSGSEGRVVEVTRYGADRVRDPRDKLTRGRKVPASSRYRVDFGGRSVWVDEDAIEAKSLPRSGVKEGFSGRKRDSRGAEICYQDGRRVACGNDDDGSGRQEAGAGEAAAEDQQIEEEGPDVEPEKAPPPEGEKIAPPPCEGCEYTPDPTDVDPETKVAKAARVGVPAMEVPPPPKEIPRLPNLTEKERAAETRFAEAYLADPDGMADEYQKLKEEVVGKDDKGVPQYRVGDHPKIFNTDDAKALSPDYNPPGADPETVKDARGTYNAAVHQTANALAKRAFVRYLDKVAQLPAGQKRVLVTSGGVAAGKGYALKQGGPETEGLLEEAGAVWDAAGEQNATENPWVLAECRKRGIPVVFAFVHADPEQVWADPKRGVVERAGKIGRMVDAVPFSESYGLGAKNFKAFMDEHIDDPDVAFYIVDNATGGQPRAVPEMPPAALEVDAAALYAKAAKIMEERKARLPGYVYRGGTIGQRIWGKPQPEPAAAPQREGTGNG